MSENGAGGAFPVVSELRISLFQSGATRIIQRRTCYDGKGDPMTENKRPEARKEVDAGRPAWERPELHRMQAGGAENAAGPAAVLRSS